MKGPTMTPQFRAAFTMAAAGVFAFVAGVAIIGHHRATGGAAALTGAMLLAVAFPRLWSTLPGLPTGKIEPAIEAPARTARPPSSSAGPRVPLWVDEPAAEPPPPAPAVPPGIDPVTGELVGDRVTTLETEVAELRALLSEQADLVARGYAALREELTRG